MTSTQRELGFGIIGCGVVSDWHIYGIKHTEGARLIAVADAVKERAQNKGESEGVPYYQDYQDLLAREDIEVVNICVPSGLHKEIAVAAANAGKHVIVEKPLDITLERIDQIINACEKAGVKLSVIYQSRFFDSTRKIKKAIDQGKFGKLVLGDVYNKYYRPQEYYDSGNWRGTWKLDGGGALMNQSIHGIDLLQYLMGPVKSLFAYSKVLVRNIETEDTAVAVIEFKNGAIGTIEGATSVYPSYERRLEIHGEKGSVRVEGEEMVDWAFVDEVDEEKYKKPEKAVQKKLKTSSNGSWAIPIDTHQPQIEGMVKAIWEDRSPVVDGHEARKAVEIILAAYQSAKTNKPVSLPL